MKDKILLEDISKSFVLALLSQDKSKSFVITPISILKKIGFPVSDQNFILENKSVINKIKVLLKELEVEGILSKRLSKQDFKGIKETGYDLIMK